MNELIRDDGQVAWQEKCWVQGKRSHTKEQAEERVRRGAKHFKLKFYPCGDHYHVTKKRKGRR